MIGHQNQPFEIYRTMVLVNELNYHIEQNCSITVRQYRCQFTSMNWFGGIRISTIEIAKAYAFDKIILSSLHLVRTSLQR